jgi:hypothetical protein
VEGATREGWDCFGKGFYFDTCADEVKNSKRERANVVSICHDGRMKGSIPRTLALSPMSIGCPYCGAEPGRDCMTTKSGFAAVHVQRIKDAARINTKRKDDRKV